MWRLWVSFPQVEAAMPPTYVPSGDPREGRLQHLPFSLPFPFPTCLLISLLSLPFFFPFLKCDIQLNAPGLEEIGGSKRLISVLTSLPGTSDIPAEMCTFYQNQGTSQNLSRVHRNPKSMLCPLVLSVFVDRSCENILPTVPMVLVRL